MARILIADDSEDIRMLVSLLVTSDGTHEVVAEATTPEEAIAFVAEHQPDAIVLDQSFNAERSGIDIAPELRGSAPQMKILLFTAYQMLENDIQSNPSIDGFLLKTKTSDLVPTLEHLLAQ